MNFQPKNINTREIILEIDSYFVQINILEYKLKLVSEKKVRSISWYHLFYSCARHWRHHLVGRPTNRALNDFSITITASSPLKRNRSTLIESSYVHYYVPATITLLDQFNLPTLSVKHSSELQRMFITFKIVSQTKRHELG